MYQKILKPEENLPIDAGLLKDKAENGRNDNIHSQLQSYPIEGKIVLPEELNAKKDITVFNKANNNYTENKNLSIEDASSEITKEILKEGNDPDPQAECLIRSYMSHLGLRKWIEEKIEFDRGLLLQLFPELKEKILSLK